MAPDNMTTQQARQVINRIYLEMGVRRNAAEASLISQASQQQPVTAQPTLTPPTGAAGGPQPPVSGGPAPTAAPTHGAGLPSYADEAAAIAAGHKAGDRVMIGGVSGTLQ